MPLWTPQTEIRFCSNVGITKEHKAYFSTNAAMIQWLSGKVKFTDLDLSYQRADERQYTIVQHNYYDLLECDVIYWKNSGFSSKFLVALITSLEWVNPNTTKVYFEIDPYSSFCGEINWQSCLVEREMVNDDWAANSPNWDNIGVPEDFDGSPVFMSSNFDVDMSPNKFLVITPYDSNGEPVFNLSEVDGICTGLNMLEFDTVAEVQGYLNTVAASNTAILDNISGVISINDKLLNNSEFNAGQLDAPWVTYNGVYYNGKTFSSQYCLFIISSLSSGAEKKYLPELMTWQSQTQIKGKACLAGGVGGIALYPLGYRNTPQPYEDAFVLDDIPEGAWVGDRRLDNKTVNTLGIVSKGVTGVTGVVNSGISGAIRGAAIGGLAGGIAGGAFGIVGSAAGTVTDIMSQMTRYNMQSVTEGGKMAAGANLAVGISGQRIRCAWLVCTEQIMKSVDDFFSRFGYKINRLKVPNVNTRPLWNYVKTSEAHIGGDIPANYREDIEDMLNAGVTFWHTNNREIGDFSNPQANQPSAYIGNDYNENPPAQEPEEPTPTDPAFPEPDPEIFSVLPDEVDTYSLAADGNTYIGRNFRVKEFKCNDGTDTILISKRLVELLQIIRDHFNQQVIITSGYRTTSYNAQVGGATKSQHLYGRAADIIVQNISPIEVYNYVNSILKGYSGGIGCYRSKGYVHVDVRPSGYWRDNNV